MDIAHLFLLDESSHAYIYYYLSYLFIYFSKLQRFLRTTAVGVARLPFSKNGSRLRVFLWSFVEIEDVAVFVFGNQIALLNQHFELIPTGGLRHSHFLMDGFGRKLKIVAVHVSDKVEVEAQGGCVEVFISIIQIALLEKVLYRVRDCFPMARQ